MDTIEQAREVASRIWTAGYVDESATIDALIAELEKVTVERDHANDVCDSYVAELAALKSQEPVAYEWRKRMKDGIASGSPYYVWSMWEPLVAPYMDARDLSKTDPENYQLRPLYLAAGAQPAPKQGPTQPGYQLVPVEPTEGMVIKFAQIFNVSNQSGTFRPAYKAMLAAAKE